MLSQLGCVTIDPQVIQAAYLGESLSPEDQARFAAHPQVARDLLINIPRLEPIAWMISQQLIKDSPQTAPAIAGSSEAIVFGAKMLKLAVAFDDLRLKGRTEQNAIAELRGRSGEFGSKLVDALADIKPESAKMELRKVPVSSFTTGMIVQQEIRTREGVLMVAKGQEITHALMIKLDSLSRAGTIDKKILVQVLV